MKKTDTVYHNLGYWYLSFIALVFAGFYYTYFSVLSENRPTLIHVHFILMATWIGMLIIQPFLIKFKKRELHRLIGKASYLLVPLILAVSFIIIRREYRRHLFELRQQVLDGLSNLSEADILRAAAKAPIGIFYFTWFALFYLLAMINRQKSSAHARYILATSLTLLGPIVDRILAVNFHLKHIAGFIPVYAGSFIIIDLVLVIMLIKDIKNNRSVNTLFNCIFIYLSGQALYFIAPGYDWWASFMSFLMKPVQ